MEIRPLTPADLRFLGDIDATVESTQYLHLERIGEGVAVSMRVEARPLREKKIMPNPIDDDLAMSYRQIASASDEGIALAAEHDGQLVAAAVAQPQPGHATMRLLDVRVDYDFRRQGIASAMAFQIIQETRDADLRAVAAEVLTSNFPANQFLLKIGFDLSGIDVRRHSNHDMVKESATLFWYAALAATSLVFGAAYTLWMYKRVVFGPIANDHVARLKDINLREVLFLALLAVVVLGMGVWPQPMSVVLHTSVNDLLAHVAQSKL
jgi:GNAT superfamily N-acetyltransferase